MKKLLFLLFSITVVAQNQSKLNANFLVDRTAHLVIEIEGVEKNLYVKGAVEYAPNIKGGFFVLGSALGLSTDLRQCRIYTAPKIQFILRGGNVYPSAGFELGIDKTFNSGLIIGIRGSYDYRSDFEYWDKYAAEWRPSGFVKVGWRIK